MTTNVTVSERAALRIGEILSQEPAGTMLRVSVAGGGCSGFQYKFDTDRAKADDDIVIERAGATVLFDPVSLNYMAGSEIDFVDDLIGSAFKVNNPQATASCGCGSRLALWNFILPVRIATWNVNSIKQRHDSARAWLAERNPDTVCLQETKCVDDAFPRDAFES